MSAEEFQNIVKGTFSRFHQISQKLGDEIAEHSKIVGLAFQAQQKFLVLVDESKQPSSQNELMRLLKPTSDQISAIQIYREKHRTSSYFNHLSAVSESIPALGWVTVNSAPSLYVKEMNNAGQFYTNRVLKDWKETNKRHLDWVKAWIQTLNELQFFIKKHHPTGLVWGRKISTILAPIPPASSSPSLKTSAPPSKQSENRNVKFLKKITSESNRKIREGSAPQPTISKVIFENKQPKFFKDGKRWLIEYQKDRKDLSIPNTEMNNTVYVFKCIECTVTVKGKLNSIILDSCKKSCIIFDDLVSSIEFINCQSIQMQVWGKVPTILVDKTDGCQIYLSPESLDAEIVSSKSSEINVIVPKENGNYSEYSVPEQFKTHIVSGGRGLHTAVVENKRLFR